MSRLEVVTTSTVIRADDLKEGSEGLILLDGNGSTLGYAPYERLECVKPSGGTQTSPS